MWTVRRGVVIGVVAVVLVIGTSVAWYLIRTLGGSTPGCVATGATGSASSTPPDFTLTVEQADNAATIAGVGIQLGMPDHAVSVALATAMQESRLRNLPSGDRDSAGLFQQRPSQGWGTHAQVVDPVHASTAFYERLRTEPNWSQLSVTQAAQLVQHSATPDAYAQWEPEARAIASALTGERAAALSCQHLTIAAPSAALVPSLVPTALAELGTGKLSGAHNQASGWAISSWLVAHASRLDVDRVTFDGSTWTASSGTWSHTGSADGMLTFHQVSGAATQG
ncbi:MAG TPA: hypothetical protein VNW94_21310 [Streptosporangiaceae bacterium]|nr:hypothetical protein [Streptosporangiaceae bacterium]